MSLLPQYDFDPVTGLPIPKVNPSMGFPSPQPMPQPSLGNKFMSVLGGPEGLMQLGAGLLSASGPSEQRISLGQALGSGLVQNQAFKQQQQENQLKQLLLMSQIQRNKQKEQQNKNHVIGNALVDDAGRVVYQGSALDNTFGRVNPGDYTPESLAEFQKTGDWKSLKRVWAPVNPSVQLVGGVPTVVQPSRTGAAPTQSPLSTPEQELDAARRAAEAKKAGQVTGETVATAQLDLPRIEQNTSQALQTIDQLKKHPGLPYITGLYSAAPIIPNTPQAGADALAKQIQGKTFLEAFTTLKGGGAITEIEGGKAEAAIARLQRSQTRREYIQALSELESVMKVGLDRARRKAQAPGAHPRSREEILKQYGLVE